MFGPATTVELVALVGYYSLVAMTLNVFDPDALGGGCQPSQKATSGDSLE